MKDIKQVSLNSVVFYVEEDGYIALKQYIENLERYYADKENGKEIVEDIQIRFAELLSEKRTFTEQAITLSNIEAVIAVLGYPDSFEAEENRSFKQQEIPPNKKRKQLYRDLENAKIAGVCSGLSHYFGIDVWVFRLIFIFLGIFSAGFWLFVYIVLWFILPAAKTTQQRYDMKGEALNIEDIEQRVKNVVNEAESKIRDFTNKKKVKDFANNSTENFKNTANEISSGAKNLFNFLAKLFGFCLAFTSICAITAILLLWFFPTSSFFSIEKEYSIFYLREIFTVFGLNNLAFFLILTCILLPFIFLLLSGISLITSKLRKAMSVVVLTTFILWIVLSVFVGIGIITFIGNKSIPQTIEPVTIEFPVSTQSIIIKPHPDMTIQKAGTRVRFFNRNLYIKSENNRHQIYGIPNFSYALKETNDSIILVRVLTNFSDELFDFQNNIKLEDSIIYIPSLFHFKNNHWSGEVMRVEVSVPKGIHLRVEEPFLREKAHRE